MTEYRFEREARTPHSEIFTIDDGEHSLGRVDIHYTSSATYATLAVHQALEEDGVQALITAIDERIVSTADPYREDFIVTVWRGEEFGVFADETDFEDEEDIEGDEDEEQR
jgi:hypothetical protein